MKTRIITAIVAALVFLPFLYFSDTFAWLIFATVVSVVSVFELLRCIGLHKNILISVPAYISAVGISLLTRLSESTERFFLYIFAFEFILLFYFFSVAVFSKGKVRMTQAAVLSSMHFYICYGYSSLVLLRDMQNGLYIMLMAFFIPWFYDSSAYFTGRFLGKHKLIPDVSPKKTVEGLVGGIIISTLLITVYCYCINNFVIHGSVNYLAIILLGLAMCFIAQCGDLITSLIKRHYNIKDFGKILPGHGGFLDRFDSVIPTAAILYIMFSLSDFFLFFN